MADTIQLSLPTPDTFPAFPYNPPYSIQVQLMRHLYTSIERKQVTIVESPTGTGKTLSLLCSSLSWLADEKNRAKKAQLTVPQSESGVDWVISQTIARRKRELEAEEADYEMRLSAARKREEAIRKMTRAKVTKKPRLYKYREDAAEDAAFLPDDTTQFEGVNVSSTVRALMQNLEQHSSGLPAVLSGTACTKVYYASRTHSQLAQILPELRRLKLASLKFPSSQTHLFNAEARNEADASLDPQAEQAAVYTRTVSLASRKQLCINDSLRAAVKDLDEGCRALLGEKQEKKCPFLLASGDESSMLEFRDQILAYPKDIEELATAGRLSNICPYFGSRRAIAQAELVMLPYNLLLQRTAREALGIDLHNQIVIIDEAHNLIPTLLSLSSVQVHYSAFTSSLEQISAYLSRYRTRLSPSHVLHLKRLTTFLSAIKEFGAKWQEQRQRSPENQQEVLTIVELIHHLGRHVEGINLLEIGNYLRSSKIARKIAAYSDHVSEKRASTALTPVLHVVESFLLALSAPAQDGCVILASQGSHNHKQMIIRYQLLNPSTQFQDVVDVARCLVLAGGTMSPVSDIVSQLFSHLSPSRLTTFSCGHIIPTSNLHTLVISQGPQGKELEFKYSQQGDHALVTELGHTLLNLTRIVPRGLVVFFPSYSFLNTAISVWAGNSTLDKFGVKKKVIVEPQDSTQVESVLQDYAVHAATKALKDGSRQQGALLLAVIGAKLSEGLNFSDDLARAVVVVGLPFANIHSPEIQERMKYANRLNGGVSRDAGAELYENMCMSAVNQSIGRAIRHKGDWAAIILLDKRYASMSISSKLPCWIGDKKEVALTFGQAMKSLGGFFGQLRE